MYIITHAEGEETNTMLLVGRLIGSLRYGGGAGGREGVRAGGREGGRAGGREGGRAGGRDGGM